MAKMFANDTAEFDSTAGAAIPASRPTGLSGIFKAVVERLSRSRQRQVDSEVGAFLAQHGGLLTDDLERQISRKFGHQAGQW